MLFRSGGKLFSSVFGLNYKLAVFIGAIVVVGYTFLGGFLAVCWTDFIQAVLMVIALIVLPCIVIVQSGGIGQVLQAVDGELLNAFSLEVLVPTGATSNAFMAGIGILSSLAWGFGYFGQPHILTRFMAIKDPEEITRSRRVAMVWVIISLIAATFIGLIGHVAFAELSAVDRKSVV